LIVFGIDPGLRKTGWGIINTRRNKMKHVDNGFIDNSGIINDGDRLLNIYSELKLLLNHYKPFLVGIEKTFVGPGNLSSLKLGMARGTCILAVARNKITICELAPKIVKKSITGSGLANKYQVSRMVQKLLQVVPKNEDSSDALAIAIAANNSSSWDHNLTHKTNDNNLSKAIKLALEKEKFER